MACGINVELICSISTIGRLSTLSCRLLFPAVQIFHLNERFFTMNSVDWFILEAMLVLLT